MDRRGVGLSSEPQKGDSKNKCASWGGSPGLCLPYPFTCTPRAVVVYRKDRKERVDTDGRRHTFLKPSPGRPGGATAPARAVAHNSGTCLPHPWGSVWVAPVTLCPRMRALIPLRLVRPEPSDHPVGWPGTVAPIRDIS